MYGRMSRRRRRRRGRRCRRRCRCRRWRCRFGCRRWRHRFSRGGSRCCGRRSGSLGRSLRGVAGWLLRRAGLRPHPHSQLGRWLRGGALCCRHNCTGYGLRNGRGSATFLSRVCRIAHARRDGGVLGSLVCRPLRRLHDGWIVASTPSALRSAAHATGSAGDVVPVHVIRCNNVFFSLWKLLQTSGWRLGSAPLGGPRPYPRSLWRVIFGSSFEQRCCFLLCILCMHRAMTQSGREEPCSQDVKLVIFDLGKFLLLPERVYHPQRCGEAAEVQHVQNVCPWRPGAVAVAVGGGGCGWAGGCERRRLWPPLHFQFDLNSAGTLALHADGTVLDTESLVSTQRRRVHTGWPERGGARRKPGEPLVVHSAARPCGQPLTCGHDLATLGAVQVIDVAKTVVARHGQQLTAGAGGHNAGFGRGQGRRGRPPGLARAHYPLQKGAMRAPLPLCPLPLAAAASPAAAAAAQRWRTRAWASGRWRRGRR